MTVLDYVSGLNGNDLTEDRIRQYHWLWPGKRQCARVTPSTTITVQMADSDDAIVIEALYGYLVLVTKGLSV